MKLHIAITLVLATLAASYNGDGPTHKKPTKKPLTFAKAMKKVEKYKAKADEYLADVRSELAKVDIKPKAQKQILASIMKLTEEFTGDFKSKVSTGAKTRVNSAKSSIRKYAGSVKKDISTSIDEGIRVASAYKTNITNKVNERGFNKETNVKDVKGKGRDFLRKGIDAIKNTHVKNIAKTLFDSVKEIVDKKTAENNGFGLEDIKKLLTTKKDNALENAQKFINKSISQVRKQCKLIIGQGKAVQKLRAACNTRLAKIVKASKKLASAQDRKDIDKAIKFAVVKATEAGMAMQ